VTNVVRERASEIAERCDLQHPINRAPSTIAASAVYVIALAENEPRTQMEVSEAADVSRVAIRNGYQEIREYETIPLDQGAGRIGRPPKHRRRPNGVIGDE
jgi:transcription initiation factor TFIIIB Brf1 subunit/transcription initiation factor TFIIB